MEQEKKSGDRNAGRKIGVLVKTSLVDFPGRVSSAFFLTGCNLRCPYCHNGDIVLGKIPEDELSGIEELYAHLEKRKNVISGFVLSGGEPLVNPHAEEILRAAKKLGYAVKLDTNGTMPERLEKIIEDPATSPDLIAMDVKTSPEKYETLLFPRTHEERLSSRIKKSIKILSALPSEKREFRTVLVPGIVQKEDITAMSNLLPKDSDWFFSRFRSTSPLDPECGGRTPLSEPQEKEFLEEARKNVPNAKFR